MDHSIESRKIHLFSTTRLSPYLPCLGTLSVRLPLRHRLEWPPDSFPSSLGPPFFFCFRMLVRECCTRIHNSPFVIMRIKASCRLCVLFVARFANPSIQDLTVFSNNTASAVDMVARRKSSFDNLTDRGVSRPRGSDGLMRDSGGSHRWEEVLNTHISMPSHQA
jgi:hypothetical protein